MGTLLKKYTNFIITAKNWIYDKIYNLYNENVILYDNIEFYVYVGPSKNIKNCVQCCNLRKGKTLHTIGEDCAHCKYCLGIHHHIYINDLMRNSCTNTSCTKHYVSCGFKYNNIETKIIRFIWKILRYKHKIIIFTSYVNANNKNSRVERL